MCLSTYWKWCCALLVTVSPIGHNTLAQVISPSVSQMSRPAFVYTSSQEREGALLGVTLNSQSAVVDRQSAVDRRVATASETDRPPPQPAVLDRGAIYPRQVLLEPSAILHQTAE